MSLTRRTVLAAIPAIGIAPIVPAKAAPVDPLASLIETYRAGIATLNAIPADQITRENEDALVMATYGPASDRLYFDPPAPTTLRGAAEAIRLAFETDVLEDGIAQSALREALAYLDGRAHA